MGSPSQCPSTYAGSRAELWRIYRERDFEGVLRRMCYHPSPLRCIAGKAKRRLKVPLGGYLARGLGCACPALVAAGARRLLAGVHGR